MLNPCHLHKWQGFLLFVYIMAFRKKLHDQNVWYGSCDNSYKVGKQVKWISMIACRKWIWELFSNFESVCKQWWENWSKGTKIKCCILYLSNIFSFILFDSLFLFHFWGRVIFLKNTLRIIIFCSLPFIKHTSFLPFTLLFFNFAWWLYF